MRTWFFTGVSGVIAAALVAVVCAAADTAPLPAPARPGAPEVPSPILPGRPDASEAPTQVLPDRPGSEEMGSVFESQSAGISLRPPGGMKLVGRVDADHIAEWVDDSRNWVLKLSRAALDNPRPLTSNTTPGKEVQGMLEGTIANLQHDLPNCKILRQDVTNIAGGDVPTPPPGAAPVKPKPNVGIVVVRYTADAQRRLTQQALIAANEQLYYVLTLTTPGNRSQDDKAPEDAQERAAVEAFQRMLDTVHLLDRAKIRDDQDNRLFRTRSFFVNLSASKLREALVPEQWFRVLQDGRDIGYTYVVEQQAGGLPKADAQAVGRARETATADAPHGQIVTPPKMLPGEDILIGVRSRITTVGLRQDKTQGPIQTDSESWMFVTADRKHEDWSRLIVRDEFRSVKKAFSEELGSMDEHLVGFKSGASLAVSQNANSVNLPPIEQDVPPFYLSQALGHLLPRILPVKQPKTYAFASFISDARAVMMRYVDVDAPQRVSLGGQLYRVIPISDRVGFDGSPTVHYISADAAPDGKHRYLGSENKDSRTTVLASDAETIQKIWANANLTRPNGVQSPAPPPGAQTSGAGLPGVAQP